MMEECLIKGDVDEANEYIDNGDSDSSPYFWLRNLA